MTQAIESIDGKHSALVRGLRAAGCTTVEKLLQSGATRDGRQRLVAASGLTEQQVLRAVHRADLYRIKGIGRHFAELLEAAGVGSVRELRSRRAEQLAERLAEIHGEQQSIRQIPSAATLDKWVMQAKELPPKVR